MSSTSAALVTVAMPVFNGERTLGVAIRSLQRQTYANWELLVVDDGSTDGTREVIRRFADQDHRIVPAFGRRNEGLVARLNEAIGAARGPLVARMDADDISFPRRLEEQVSFLGANPRVDLVGSAMIVFQDGGATVRKWGAPVTHGEICRRPGVGFRLYHPTWLGRTEWFRANRYRPQAVRCEDQDLLARTYCHSVFANLPQPLVGYREPHKGTSKRLRGRVNYVRLSRRTMHGKEGSRLASGIAWHALRGAIDVGGAALGMQDALFRAASVRVSSCEREQWLLARAGGQPAPGAGVQADFCAGGQVDAGLGVPAERAAEPRGRARPALSNAIA